MSLLKRSFTVAGHRTSVALEPAFWDALAVRAEQRGQSLATLVAAVDAARAPGEPLASSLRVFVITASD